MPRHFATALWPLLVLLVLPGPALLAVPADGPDGAGRQALLLVGFQESHFPEGEVDPGRGTARQAGRVLQEFRKGGEMVVHLLRGAPGQNPASTFETEPEPGEAVLLCRHANPFLQTELLDLLRSQGVEGLVICGVRAELEVEAAVRAAADLGFRCTLLSDASLSGSLRWRGKTLPAEDVLLSTMISLRGEYARVMTTDAWLASH